ncbi:putative DNA-binding helix-hairpin-helix protein [Hydrogenivirga caldilitoris]|uniref:Putative DNA-binding helix-hairpin-helix protein n=1 Tax=Hydrogenivirga caldilitoris TaxID=246264 RepID=A0A497XQ99_9AQUI|nr:radical SAM protein [Hydrogenivirga caldilitoris]RLJ70309.1 putative DNA-binding helix-hairpin-helix protein [Hydrogenivirga caldilitoris]
MEPQRKLRLLSKLAKFECEKEPDLEGCIYKASTPMGKKPILKTMLSTYCDKNCDYCVFRRDRDNTPRLFINPEDMAKGFMELYRKGRVRGLFLSSGIFIHPEVTMEKLIDTASILRKRYGYKGYIHLKLMPGVSLQTLEEAVKLADRISMNIEAPNEDRLKRIAKGKSLRNEIIPKIAQVSRLLENYESKSHITQVMVGVSGETDEELLRSSEYLYRKLRLNRVYYSAFFPVKDTPLENRPPESKRREHRLYQADFLIRDYGFSWKELPFENGKLPEDRDPKEAWAERNIHLFPVELNRADYELLIKVPGIGIETAREIIRRRLKGALKTPEDLKGIRNLKKILNYVTLMGRYYGDILVYKV